MVFGANNVQVNSPSWLLGHFSIDDVTFDYNRVFVIGFAIVIVIGTWLLLTKTPLGLLIRAVMQNRAMASCLGVRTARVNMLTFAFGSGLGGLGRGVSLANRQRRPQPGPNLYRGQFHDRRRGRRRQHCGHGLLGLRHRHGGRGAAADDRFAGHRKNRGVGGDHSLPAMETRRAFCQPQPEPGLNLCAPINRNRKNGVCWRRP